MPAVYTKSDSRIEESPGSEFIIKLPANPATGYTWALAEDYSPETIKLIESEYQDPEIQRRGIGGHTLWRFKAIAPGQTELTFNYRRSWEKDVPPSQSITFSVTVK